MRFLIDADLPRSATYLASRMGLPEEEAAAVFEEGRAWAEAADNVRLRSAVLTGFARFRFFCLGDARGSVPPTEEALRLATEAGDREARLVALVMLGSWLSWVGRPREGLAMVEAALELAAGDTAVGVDILGFSPYHLALSTRGIGKHVLGHLEESDRDAERAVALAARESSTDFVALSHFNAAQIAFARGDAGACTRHALAGLDVAAKVGPAHEAWGLYTLGCAHLVGANWSQAVVALERALEIIHRHPLGLFLEAFTFDRLAEAHLAAGEMERARSAADEAIAAAEKRGTKGWGYRGPVTLARVLLASSGAATRAPVEAALAAAQAQVDQSGERVHQPFIHLARAELATALGDGAGRQRELREAHRLFTEMGAPIRAAQVAKELAP